MQVELLQLLLIHVVQQDQIQFFQLLHQQVVEAECLKVVHQQVMVVQVVEVEVNLVQYLEEQETHHQ
ncbi:MAG: hypothetical protein EB170_09165 [Nitrosopumilaceae archaeon]|nr:hypothetical protein [Nitrosopumilaceae archaeon]